MQIGILTGNDANGQCSDTAGWSAPPRSATQAERCFTIRELHATDVRACELFFRRLDPHDVRMRFASPRAFSADLLLPRSSSAAASAAFAAVDPTDAILGIVNLVCIGSGSAEIAIVVRSDHKRRGIGRSLVKHVVQRAARDGFSHLFGYVLAENRPALALAEDMRFERLRRDGFFIVVSRRLPTTVA